MQDVTNDTTVALITESPDSELSAAIETISSFDVRTISADRALESLRESTNGCEVPSGIVLEADDPATIRSVLDRVQSAVQVTPVVVAPTEGNERTAAAALRAGATEYVAADEPEAKVDRIIDAITELPADETSEYHRILANELPDEAFVIGEDGIYLESKVRPDTATLYTTAAGELVGKSLESVFPADVAERLQSCLERAIETGTIQTIEYGADTTEGWRQYEARVVPIERRIGGQRAVVWLARDITERAQRERRLQSRQDRLETVNRINQVVRQVIETLVEAPTQATIERKVCEQLVESELYCGAWIAERTGEGELSYRTGDGSAKTYLEAVESCDPEDQRPAQRAVKSGELQVIDDVLADESVPERIREAARADGIDAAVVVPISHGGTTYGVLAVVANRNDTFSESERSGFQLLGETTGFTISAVKNRQLLFSDTVLELEFRVDDGETFTFYLTTEYDCTVSLEWAGSTADGRIFQYVTVDGLDGETVLEEAEDHDSIEECRLIYDGTDGCTLEIRMEESGVRTLAHHGATIRDVAVENGSASVLVEVPRDADVREVAEALKFVYENTELEARREVDHPVRTAAERRHDVLDQLTDRQLTTLRLAYYSGFFDWPRESTGEEIAEAMDVSPPTMHQHLRKGLKTVLGELFEESGGTV
ncbi:bacterio-opsin activator domain-containing protein [Natronococcus sp. A-GB7]|uniref:bacterio-opsin activator domain-containing protein n=1 Tax=Natronococcus sp. A-GB7 TaxID=3037649 RepID=UPI00241CB207|nr:bacterio-opsin activator domain-containing protein [Natronococcus sp. A-GB7]MDG5820984.1 bacterio-opsin activator domain-containing protein [Natronococcus sp. A-GB7]